MGKKGGCGFVRFGSFQEAEKGMALAHGRSSGGRKIQMQLSRFKQDKTYEPDNFSQARRGAMSMNPWSIKSAWKGDPEPQMNVTSNPSMGGCIVKNGENLGVRLASDVINEGKKGSETQSGGMPKRE